MVVPPSSVFVSVQLCQLLYVVVLRGFLPSRYGPSTKGKFIINGNGPGRSCYCYLLLLLLLLNQYLCWFNSVASLDFPTGAKVGLRNQKDGPVVCLGLPVFENAIKHIWIESQIDRRHWHWFFIISLPQGKAQLKPWSFYLKLIEWPINKVIADT